MNLFAVRFGRMDIASVACNALAAIPLLVVALPRRPWSVVAAAFVLSVALGALFFRLYVRHAQRRLRDAVEAGSAQGVFHTGTAGLPAEYAGVADAIRLATDRVGRREAELKEATAKQALAMQEIHHRVKNNLQIVASLLNLQASRIKVPAAQAEFQSARDRVRALATLHRHLYAHGEIQTIAMRAFLTELCGQLFSAFGETPGARIDLSVDAPDLEMTSDQAVPLSLIVTEAVSNAVKFAFPEGRRGAISVRLSTEGDAAELVIIDDGVGIETPRPPTPDGTGEGRRDGIGLQLIRGFVRQLGGTLDMTDGVGTRYTVHMKLMRERAVVSAQGIASRTSASPANATGPVSSAA